MKSATRIRIDLRSVRPSIDLTDVATRLMGPPDKQSGRLLMWRCRFHHPDNNPSLGVDPARQRWRCYPCDLGGDAIELVRRLNPGWSFPEVVAYATGRPVPLGGSCKPSKPWKPPADRPTGKTAIRPPDGPKGLPLADARELVREAERRLWSPEGRAALVYLIESRGLTEATIKAARLGWTPRADGVPWKPPGWVIPWLDGDRLVLVKIRVPDEWLARFPKDQEPPKYIEAFRDRPALYPSLEAIRPGASLIATEGEFDALLLGQELLGLASVVTTGSSSNRPDESARKAMRRCPTRFIALDADRSGDDAATGWPGLWTRVRPPAGKDWTESFQAGFDLRRWWVEEHFPLEFDRQERAAIMEHDGGLSREQAERAAGLLASSGDVELLHSGDDA